MTMTRSDPEISRMTTRSRSGSEFNGTFRFRRYQEEALIRSQVQQNTADVSSILIGQSATTTTTKTIESTNGIHKYENDVDDDDNDDDGNDVGGSVLQNLSDSTIIIDTYGKVVIINNRKQQQQQVQQQQPIHVPTGTTLLIRNLRNCIVTIELSLPAIHFVGIENTTIDYYNSSENTNNTFVDDDDHDHDHDHDDDDDTSSKVAVVGSTTTDNIANTTIHMTDCRGQSSLRLQIPVQQLRIHQSTGLHIKTMMNQNQNLVVKTKTAATAWKPGTIILETSKDIIFFVPPLPLVLENNASSTNTNSEINIVTQQQQQQDQLLSRTSSTKTYWHQVIVKDFQWLRKGISSPNFLVVVVDDEDNGSNKDNLSDNIERTTHIPQGIDDEDNNSSDDEL